MSHQILEITNFIINAFLAIWPYLLITIPLAVAVQLSGASKYIDRAFQARPVTAIFLATAVGAFSPFCSCTVIPVVASLLIGGVPLAPVMAFWIASPSMDPEAFFLSVATIGWELAVWRMSATLALSLSAGFITHFILQQGWLGQNILRTHNVTAVPSRTELIKRGWQWLKQQLTPAPVHAYGAASEAYAQVEMSSSCGDTCGISPPIESSCGDICSVGQPAESSCGSESSCGCQSTSEGSSCGITTPPSFRQRLLSETWEATTMVVKFMALAFLLEALITLYIPSEWIAGLLGHQNAWAIPLAALIGVPVYTTNLAALPLVSGLLAQGMNPAAGLAFLIAGPTTTLPAMAAVWGLTARRVFVLYISFSLVGAMALGVIYSLTSGL